jgi:hypothetical protein
MPSVNQIKIKIMKLNCRTLLILVLILSSITNLSGQDKKQNYGKAPDEIFPYDKYAKPYKYHTNIIF